VLAWLVQTCIIMAQLMPLPLTVSCFSKIQFSYTFLLPAHPGSPRKRAVKRVRVRVYVLKRCRKRGFESSFVVTNVLAELHAMRACGQHCRSAEGVHEAEPEVTTDLDHQGLK